MGTVVNVYFLWRKKLRFRCRGFLSRKMSCFIRGRCSFLFEFYVVD